MRGEFTQEEIMEQRKKNVMNEDEQIKASQILDYYRASWEDKDDRKLFQLYNLIEIYWEGEANRQYYVGDPASNVNIVHPNVETIVGLIVDKNMSVETTAETPSERRYISDINSMMEFIMRKNRTVFKTYDFARRLTKFGTGIFRAWYDPEGIDYFGLPTMDGVNPAYLFVDPNIVDMEDIQDGAFVIETDLRSIESARREYGHQKASAIVAGYDPTYNATIFGEEPNGGREAGSQYYIHMLVWLKEWIKGDEVVAFEGTDGEEEDMFEYELKLRLIEMSGDGVILRDTATEGEDAPYFPDEMYPYFIGINYKREGCAWGKGDAELMLDPQDQLNDYDDQIRQYMRLVGNPQRWIDPNSGCDPRKWTNEAGLTVPIIGGTANAGYFHPAPMQPQLAERRDRIMDRDVQTITRINSQMMGQRQKGVDSATEALSLRESSDTVLNEKSETVRETLNRVYEYLFKLAVHYWDEEKMFAITGSQEFASFRPSDLQKIPALDSPDEEFINSFKKKNPEAEMPKYMMVHDPDTGENVTKYAEVSIQIKIGTGASKNKTFTYSVMKESWREKLLKKSTMLKYLKDELDVPIPDDEIKEAEGIEQLQLQSLQQMIQTGGTPKESASPTSTTQTALASKSSSSPEGVSAELGENFTPQGTPRRPNSTMKSEITSNAQ